MNLRTPFFKEHLCEFPSRVNASEFHEDKAFILIDIPFCKRIKINLKNLSKSSTIHKSKILYSIKWITKNVKSLKDKNRQKRIFPLIDKNIYPACKINQRLCSCKEIRRENITTRRGEYNNSTYDSEPAIRTFETKRSYKVTTEKSG